MNNIEDIKIEALKSNDYYDNALNQVKESIKQNVLSMSTKEEQIKFVLEEKNRYRLLKENKKNYALIAIIIAISSLISVILLNLLKENIVFFVLWLFAVVLLIASLAAYVVLSFGGNSMKYTIIMMAYEDIEKRLEGGAIGVSEDTERIKIMMESIKESVDVIQEQLKMIYALQKEDKRKSKK